MLARGSRLRSDSWTRRGRLSLHPFEGFEAAHGSGAYSGGSGFLMITGRRASRRAGMTCAARRARNAIGVSLIARVPSLHVRLKPSMTSPSLAIRRPGLGRAGSDAASA